MILHCYKLQYYKQIKNSSRFLLEQIFCYMLVEYFLKGSLEQGKGKDPRVKILKFRLQFNNLELIYAL